MTKQTSPSFHRRVLRLTPYWVRAAIAAGREVPKWMLTLNEKDFNETLALRESAFPATKRKG